MKKILPTALFMLFFSGLFAQEDAFHIQFTINEYEAEFLTIANSLLDQQYVVDTVFRADDGTFHFRDTSELKPGIYLAVLAPDNEYFQFLIGDERPFFELEATAKKLAYIEVNNSEENQLFYDYLGFLDQQKKKDIPLKEALEAAGPDAEDIQEKRRLIDQEVKAYQNRLIEEEPKSLVSAIIKSSIPVSPPASINELPEEERRLKGWRYLQRHFFDNINLKDDRLLRTPFLFERIDYYVHKLHVQHPDSIALAIDKVLQQMHPASDMFKTYLVHFLNEAARSKLVGMDAIYVFLIDNYYAKGFAPWTEEEQMKKFLDNANRLRPLLIGKSAPDIEMEKRDGSKISLHSVESDFTILYFWRYDCGHCKESTPVMKEFYDKWKDRGVTLFAVCAKTIKEVPPCWEYIDEKEIGDWLHTVDPYMRSRYGKLYDVTSTPAIFVLDKDKKIISKRLGADQLDDLLTKMLEQERAREKEQSGDRK